MRFPARTKLQGFVLILLAASAPVQAQSSVTKVVTSPAGPIFNVDGQNYTSSMAALWPAGSKHTLTIESPVQSWIQGAQYTFTGWQWAEGTFPQTQIVITADPAITQYTANFTVQYALSLYFNPCTSNSSPGTVYVGGAPYTCDAQIYVSAGSQAVIQAIPNSGYLFAGWASANGQTIVGFQNTVAVNGPVSVYPLFAPARSINFVTSPPGLQILADHSPITTPYTLQWGFSTSHTVGPVSPQTDMAGNTWVFSSWSDGGTPIHAYTVDGISSPATLAATYVPAVGFTLFTSPPGLTLTVDGTSAASPINYTWGAGETHTFSAPAQQTDSTGHVWAFSAWSNGGAASQSITMPASAAALGVRLTATYTPVGHLTVNSAVSGLSVMVNGSACTVPCDIKQPVGTQLDLGAPASIPLGPGSRQDLLGWTGGASGGPADLIVTLGADPIVVNAAYHVMNSLSLAANPAGAASWAVQPSSPDGFYDSQTNVSVTVTPQAGYKFHGWKGDLSGSNPSASLAMSAPRAAVAMMDKTPFAGPTGVVNGAASTPVDAVAAGSVASIFGANMASGTAIAPAGPLPQTLGGLAVHIGNRYLPLFFVSPGQINVQLPDDLALETSTLTITAQGQADLQTTASIVREAPGLFQQATDGQSFAVAFHADGSAVTTSAPAQIGELLTLYGTGFGPTNPARLEGLPIPQSPVWQVVDPVTVSAGSSSIQASGAFALPGSIGVDAAQFTLTDPSLSGSNAQISVTIGGQQSNTVLLPVQ